MTSASEIIERIPSVALAKGGAERLAEMLREDRKHFRGLSSKDAEWVRAHLFIMFELVEVPQAAIEQMKEDLRTSYSAPILVGISQALRSINCSQDEWRELLLKAQARIHGRDEYVEFEFSNPEIENGTTAHESITKTLSKLCPARVSCCTNSDTAKSSLSKKTIKLKPKELSEVAFEDQDSGIFSAAEILDGQDCLVAFFYTRCMNPEKCSLTITRLADLTKNRHETIGSNSLSILAISYDPDYDDPPELKRYGAERGFSFSDNCKLVRCTKGWSRLRRILQLRVGYGSETVNNHARELFLFTRKHMIHPLLPEMLGSLENLNDLTA